METNKVNALAKIAKGAEISIPTINKMLILKAMEKDNDLFDFFYKMALGVEVCNGNENPSEKEVASSMALAIDMASNVIEKASHAYELYLRYGDKALALMVVLSASIEEPAI